MDFENVIALEPPNRKKNTQAYTQVFRVAQYNVACCYSVKGVVRCSSPATDLCPMRAASKG